MSKRKRRASRQAEGRAVGLLLVLAVAAGAVGIAAATVAPRGPRGSFVVTRAVHLDGTPRDLVGRPVVITRGAWTEWGCPRGSWEELGGGTVRVGSGIRRYSWESGRLVIRDGNGAMWLEPR